VEAAPEDTDYLFNLGYAYALINDAPAALFWLRESVRFDAANGDAHLVMSAVLSATGKPVEAQRELDLAKLLGTRRNVSGSTLSPRVPVGLERLPTDLEAHTVARLDAAIGSPAQREQQEAARFRLEQGRRLFDQKNDRDAINELRRAIYLSPYQDEPHLLLGHAYQRTGRLPEAIDEFKVAIWCKETVEALVALGNALLESGDGSGARQQADRALILKPDAAEARALLRKIGG
jgi:Tfp pilus assembly protein PilF